jgi:hypothetical protein
VLESEIADEAIEDGKEGFGNDKVNQLSENVNPPGGVAVIGLVEVGVSPCVTVLVIVVTLVDDSPGGIGDAPDNVFDRPGIVGTEARELRVLRIDQLDVYGNPLLASVDFIGAVGGSVKEATGSPGVGGTETGGLSGFAIDQLDVYSTPVLTILVDRTGGRLGGALLFNHWVVPSITE